ncbi:SDR family NAD(P)-dependent oxidoreductase [Singulisphaera sp. PoT]|uniref:SDR family NAD(P)-dependent oxidoreductase n=1 Tax=Singulisphaera sp. PoT TaxID=3411797 RepID=UPI003BF509C9
MTRIPQILVYSPSAQPEPGIVVGASRAGAIGVLDCGSAINRIGIADAARRVGRLIGDLPFGVKLGAEHIDKEWIRSLPESAKVLVVTRGHLERVDWRVVLSVAAESDRLVVAEVGSRQLAVEAVEEGVSALIVAGHEAGGFVGDDSSLILLQAVLEKTTVPVWVRGGIGARSAAACVAGGAAGVVLDGAVLLARESPLRADVRERLARWDGGETVVIRPSEGESLRVYASPGLPALARLKAAAEAGGESWRSALQAEVGWGTRQLWPVGQDAALAGRLAGRHVTVGGIIQHVERSIEEGLKSAWETAPLASGSALAASHGTQYPIVQGPMTRVSDTVPFAEAVAVGGGLPFLALALMRGPEVRKLLDEANQRLTGRAWGVGLLGFVDPALRSEQMAEILRVPPPFALIAGGRPDQARELEAAGIETYLHIPSPGLLRQFWADGARRFVLEGRECGGHVGPRSSFVLWEQVVDSVLELLDRSGEAEEVHVLFAGGIHDSRSAAMVSAIAGPLAARGARVGVLVGTAYLFTQEAVDTGAIVRQFQDEAVQCERTVLLETGPGHEVRVSPTPFAHRFEQERRQLTASGASAEEVREALEALNAGRLRVAAKGMDRSQGSGSPLAPVAGPDQFERGLYMLGQAATLRDRVTTIAELHAEICDGSIGRLDSAVARLRPEAEELQTPSDIAIVGMSAIVPGASDVRTFWGNTLRGVDCITEVPEDRWDWRLYYDVDPKAPDKITSKWGGFLPEIPFDPLYYGMPPTSLPSIEPMQLLMLEAARKAIEDAGYRDRPYPKERTSVVLGAGGGAAQLSMGYAFRSYLPLLDTVIPGGGQKAMEQCGSRLPEWTEDSFPGILLNVAAGRVANRFDLGGANYTVDAACGSSLAAAALAVRELESGAADMVLLGGADTVQNPFTYMAFSKTQAFSPRGRCRPFDASADGIVISEGVAVVVLKRLADAERDGDKIYAVIKGLGASSDGRAKGLTAPRPEGQVRALRRAYAKAGVEPTTVGYVEAHGTGTAAGDLSEVNSLSTVFREAGCETSSCAVGSVKSQIGHTKCAAGLAGLINASLALYHNVLPPTIGVERLNPKADLADGPLYISTKTRPWLHAEKDRPRRAGVSAFGFGGTNFHAVLEAYDRSTLPPQSAIQDWPAELFVWRDELSMIAASIDRLTSALDQGAQPALRDLAYTLIQSVRQAGSSLAIVANSLEDLRSKLTIARDGIAAGKSEFRDPRGVEFAGPADHAKLGKVAFLFPGQGAQQVEMLNDLAIAFPEVRSAFEDVDATLKGLDRPTIGELVFPPPVLSQEERDRQKKALTATEVAQPSLAAASVGMLRLLESFSLAPDMTAGHSYGELVALYAAGSFSLEGLAELSEGRGRFLRDAAANHPGSMAALAAGPEKVAEILDGIDGVVAVNWNGPKQTVISGPHEGVAMAIDRAKALAMRAQWLPVACAFHSPAVAEAQSPLTSLAGKLIQSAPGLPVYSNVDARPHGEITSEIATQLGSHVVKPVQFAAMIEAMYTDGARTFIEVGPGGTLTSLVGSILGTRPHLAVAVDPPGRSGIAGLLQTLGRLFVAGLSPRWERLTEGRDVQRLHSTRFVRESEVDVIGPATWLVNGSRSRPASAAEPLRLGPGPALPVANAEPEVRPETLAAGPEPVAALPRDTEPYTNGVSHENGYANGRCDTPSRNGASSPATDLYVAPMDQEMAEPGSDVTRVFEAFQKTMQTFLEVQRETMLGFLGASRLETPSVEPAPGNGRFSPQDFEPRPRVSKPSPISTEAYAPAPVAPPRVVAPEPLIVAPIPSPKIEAPASEPVTYRNGTTTATAPAPAPSPAPATAATVDVAERLLAIVKDRTGYPAEMLQLNLDLEADLGIDSIKRVEILGTLRDALPNFPRESGVDLMDQLSRAKTLGAIVERVNKAMGGKASPKSDRAVLTPPRAERNGSHSASENDQAESREDVRRLVLESAPAPLDLLVSDLNLAPSGLVLVTDDGRGIALSLAEKLEAQGHPVVILGEKSSNGSRQGRRVVMVDFSSEDSIEALIGRIRTRGTLAGIIHALPLRRANDVGLDAQGWNARIEAEVKGLFLLARTAADDLAHSAENGGACLIAATCMGGDFASVDDHRDFFPGQGAIAGMIKTLAREWPKDVRVRVVDLDPKKDEATLATRLYQEIGADDHHSEVGYRDEERVVLKAIPTELPKGRSSNLILPEGAPILVTGGARGITAAVVGDLAKRWKPTLLIVGSSPPPSEVEDRATSRFEGGAELKAALHRRASSQGKTIGPAELERAYQELRREREIRANLEGFQASGAKVAYAQVNVRDREALGRTLSAWREKFGPIAGLIHGAGVIEDKLLRDKTTASFDRVLGTKLEGALNLAGLLETDPLKFAVFFSSVAGRFGNRGQADYAAANEILNKLALWLDRRWAARVLSVIWGPWSGVGMVSDLEAHLGRQGFGMIPPEVGATKVGDDLQFGKKGDVEVIVAGDLGSLMDDEPALANDNGRKMALAGHR